MTRQFLTEQPVPVQPAQAAAIAQSAVQVASEAVSQHAAQQKPLYQDALAGAFPEWDLLPATPFIRRVK